MCCTCVALAPDILNHPIILKYYLTPRYHEVFHSLPTIPMDILDVYPGVALPPGKRDYLIKYELEGWRLLRRITNDPSCTKHVERYKMKWLEEAAVRMEEWIRRETKGKYNAAVQP